MDPIKKTLLQEPEPTSQATSPSFRRPSCRA